MPVETISALDPGRGDVPGRGGVFVDCTFGRGGHAQGILERLNPDGRLLVMDRDPEAIEVANALATREPRLCVFHGCFDAIAQALELHGLPPVNGILFDLGVSSTQLDDPQRGFSFRNDGPLDMRMDPSRGVPAAQWLNRATVEQIRDVIRDFGEERHAGRIARAIVRARELAPLERTRQLADVVVAALPIAIRATRGTGRSARHGARARHPATKTFQAIRIFINDELALLERALSNALECLAPDGRLVVISFHSLEDRIVKRFMREQSRGPTLPRGLPITIDALPASRLVAVGRARHCQPAEMEANPRARSARLRVARRPT